MIARTNATVFKKAVQLYNKNNIGFIGGINGYRFNIIKDVYNLYAGKPVFDNYITSFDGFNGLKSYAQDVEDFELLSVCKVVEEYKHRIPALTKRITEKAVDTNDASVILTTAHKAKGLEWNNVLMMDDFKDLVREDEFIDPSEIEPDEFNLIYVTITRARFNLRIDRDSNFPAFIKLFQKKMPPGSR